jgi:hypothetical protein
VTENANDKNPDQNNSPQNGPSKSDSKFDWITARSSCSLPKVFHALRLQVEQDVKTRNGLRPNPPAYEFSLTEDTGAFTVRLEAQGVKKSVIFTLADHAISVRDGIGTPMFEVTVSFDDKGNCRLNVNGQERDFWQVRRMALEELMFRGL